MRLVHVGALLLLALALCQAQEELTDENDETTTVEATTQSLRNRLRPRLKLQTTGAPVAANSDGEVQAQEVDTTTTASVVTSAPTTSLPQTPKPKRTRNRNRNRNRKPTTPASSSVSGDDDDEVKSTSSTTRRPKSTSRSRSRSRATTRAPTDRSTTRSSKRRGSGRKTSSTQASDDLDVTTTKPTRGRKTIPPRRTRPTTRRQSSSTPAPSSTVSSHETKTTKRSRSREGLRSRTTKNLSKTTIPSTVVTTEIPTTTLRPVVTPKQEPLPGISFIPFPSKQGDVSAPPKALQAAENEKIHHKPAFASDSVLLNGGLEEEPLRRGKDGEFQGVPPKLVGPVTFNAGRRQFRPRPEEGIILDAPEKPVDHLTPPTKEQMRQADKLAGIPLTVIDPVIGGTGRDTRPVGSQPRGSSLEETTRLSSALKAQPASMQPGDGGASALLLLPPSEKPVNPSSRPFVPFQPDEPRQELLSSRLKPDGFDEENMEVNPEKDPSRLQEPVGVPPKPVGPLSIRPVPKKIVDDEEANNFNSRFAPGERVFIPPSEDRPAVTTQRSISVPSKAPGITQQHSTGNRDSADNRFTLRTEAPIRPNLVGSSSPVPLTDRRHSHRLNIAETPSDNKVAHRERVTIPPPPPRSYSDANTIRQKTRVTESPAIPSHSKEDVSGVQVKPRNNVTPFPLWIDPRLRSDSELTTPMPKDNKTPSRPVASKRVTIPFPFEEDEPQTAAKTRLPSRPLQQQRVTFVPNPLRSTTLGTTTTPKSTAFTSSFRPRHHTVTLTSTVPSTTLDDASGEDFTEEDEELEERLTFPPRRSTVAPELPQTSERVRATPAPLLDTRANTAQRDQPLNRFSSSQNSFATQQFLETPRRTNIQTARAVGINLPPEQDTVVSSSIPKASSVVAQSPQTDHRSANPDMVKGMKMEKDMMMKANPAVTISPQPEFISTEDIDDDEDVGPLELTNFKQQMPAGKIMSSEVRPAPLLPSTPLDERRSERPTVAQVATENVRNLQANMRPKAAMPLSDSQASFTPKQTFSVPPQSRFVSLENEPSSMPARGRNSLPVESGSTPSLNSFPQPMENAKAQSLPASSLPARQQNGESFDRVSATQTTPLDTGSGRQRMTSVSPIPPNSRPVAPVRSPAEFMPKDMMPMPQWEDEDPFNGQEFADEDPSLPQSAGRTPSLASNPRKPAVPSEPSKASQVFESPSFVIRKPVSKAPEQVQVVPEVPEEFVPMVKNQRMPKTDAQDSMAKMNSQPMVKTEPVEAMQKQRNQQMVKDEEKEFMPAVPMTKDAMTAMKDMPVVRSDELSQVSPVQHRPAVQEQPVSPTKPISDSDISKMVQTQSTTVAVANPEEAVDYEYYYA